MFENKTLPTPVMSVESPPETKITFHTGDNEMLKITQDGFYVRGVRVPVDDKEAEAVYRAFKQFLVWSALAQ